MIYIGIDTGVNTGVAVWSILEQKFISVFSCKILEAFNFVLDINEETTITLIIEDARKRKWYGDNAESKRQGAGSIKRDCQIWEDFAQMYNIESFFVHPKRNMTKLNAKTFRQITGWQGRTNEHSRDAAMLVFKR